ncbi:MAG: class I SAM-dependent methyltransferase [Acidobacteria bacterium]|nr:class I SAM-dependent methyltransferase [Acidobacteriota bacterium]
MAEWFEDMFDADYIQSYRRINQSSKEEVEGVIDLLSLTNDMKILDLCCGYGRHTLELARRGFKVTGYDLSSVFLENAKKKAQEEGLDIDFIYGDMRELPFLEEYDVVLNLFTSFGYFSHEENKDVLQRVARALVPNGRFLIQSLCFTGLIRNVINDGNSFISEDEGVIMLDKQTWNLEKNELNAQRKLIFDDNRRRDVNFSIKIYTLAEMLRMFHEVDLQLVDYYANLKGDPYTLDSKHFTIIVEKTP